MSKPAPPVSVNLPAEGVKQAIEQINARLAAAADREKPLKELVTDMRTALRRIETLIG